MQQPQNEMPPALLPEPLHRSTPRTAKLAAQQENCRSRSRSHQRRSRTPSPRNYQRMLLLARTMPPANRRQWMTRFQV